MMVEDTVICVCVCDLSCQVNNFSRETETWTRLIFSSWKTVILLSCFKGINAFSSVKPPQASVVGGWKVPL